MSFVRRPCVALVALALGSALAGCSTWRQLEVHDGWTLYAEKGHEVNVEAFRVAFDPAHRAVESIFGPFRGPVRVHAIDEAAPSSGALHRDATAVKVVPGIGRARVRAYHARSEGLFSAPSGIYAGSIDAGTAAHELVHARLAEEDRDLPLWFEEGLACLVGDGVLDGERWIVDGLACWPLRELREQDLDDEELGRLLAVRADDESSARENVLVHFVGWAIVFDYYREHGAIDWRAWRQSFGRNLALREARARLERTLSPKTESEWLARLSDPDRGVRLATAKGLWKLRSAPAVDALLDQIAKETDAEVKVALAINVLAAAGEMKLPRRTQDTMWPAIWPVFKRASLEDASEQSAVKNLYQSFRRRSNVSSQDALEGLRRFWAE